MLEDLFIGFAIGVGSAWGTLFLSHFLHALQCRKLRKILDDDNEQALVAANDLVQQVHAAAAQSDSKSMN